MVCSLFILGLFFIALARVPNLNVVRVSYRFVYDGEHVIIKVVLLFPPNEFYNILVNLEER